MKSLNLRHTTALLALGGSLLFVGAPAVRAEEHGRDRCQRDTEKAESKYREEVREHGRRSRQADDARARLNQVFDRCYSESSGWYDPHRREWRSDRDWDRNYDWDRDGDNDRDRDHQR
jgi:hypothetical protein